MKHQRQLRKNNCGQTCVAMLIDRTQDYVATAIENKGLTHYGELLSVLWKHGYSSNRPGSGGPYRVSRSSGLVWGNLMLCRVRFAGKKYLSHFVVADLQGNIFDPAGHYGMDYSEWRAHSPGARITSYVILRKKPADKVFNATSDTQYSSGREA